MSKPKCSLGDCDRPAAGRGYCKKHWQTWRTHGSPYGPPVTPVPDLPGEHWLSVGGYEGLYEVSDQGRVRSLDKMVPSRDNSSRLIRGRLLKPAPSTYGHLQVTLYRNGKGTTLKVHRLVGEAFLGPLPEGMETRHGPGGKLDNRLVNLVYGTTVENAEDRLRDGTHRQGSKIEWAKLTEDIVRECRSRYAAGGVTLADLAVEFRVAATTIHAAVTRQTWRHVA